MELAVDARLAARTGFSSIPLYLVVGIVLGALAPPTLVLRERSICKSDGCGRLRPTPYLRRRGSKAGAHGTRPVRPPMRPYVVEADNEQAQEIADFQRLLQAL